MYQQETELLNLGIPKHFFVLVGISTLSLQMEEQGMERLSTSSEVA